MSKAIDDVLAEHRRQADRDRLDDTLADATGRVVNAIELYDDGELFLDTLLSSCRELKRAYDARADHEALIDRTLEALDWQTDIDDNGAPVGVCPRCGSREVSVAGPPTRWVCESCGMPESAGGPRRATNA